MGIHGYVNILSPNVEVYRTYFRCKYWKHPRYQSLILFSVFTGSLYFIFGLVLSRLNFKELYLYVLINTLECWSFFQQFSLFSGSFLFIILLAWGSCLLSLYSLCFWPFRLKKNLHIAYIKGSSMWRPCESSCSGLSVCCVISALLKVLHFWCHSVTIYAVW